ncbi:MAG: hypothetical protein JXE07_06390 [Candidatus Aminicenantes bacterium]|nr:hypothetical protein [Candidatus Aminicenantes bacterium]
MKKRTSVMLLAALAGLLIMPCCETLDQITRTLLSLRRLQFKLDGVRDFSLLGINLAGKSALTDFSAANALELVQGFRSQWLPAELTLDILVQNPNDGTGGSTKATSTLTSLESRLLIDGTPTVYGNIDQPIEVPGTGQATTIPVRMSIDLYEFFGRQGYEKIIGLALAIGGKHKDMSRISLDAQPSVSTPFGEIVYPGRITIVEKEFRY